MSCGPRQLIETERSKILRLHNCFRYIYPNRTVGEPFRAVNA